MKHWLLLITGLSFNTLHAQTNAIRATSSDLPTVRTSPQRTSRLLQFDRPEGRWTLEKYTFDQTPVIGRLGALTVREGGISGLCYRGDGTFLMISDRGPNIEAEKCVNAKGRSALVFPFPKYAPKIWNVKAEEGELRIQKMITVKRPEGVPSSGLLLPEQAGKSAEVAWSDTTGKELPRDAWGLDSEGLVQDRLGNFWLCDEYGTSIWKLNPQGRVVARYTPLPQMPQDQPLDSALAFRRPNRGFEGITMTPNGLIYFVLQSPAHYPNASAGNASRLHRLVELDPGTGRTRTFVYEHAPEQGSIRNQDWKIGDLTAVNNEEFLVLEHAERGKSNVKNVYKISLVGATPLEKVVLKNTTLEQLGTAEKALAAGIQVVKKDLLADLLALGWEDAHDKPEGLAVMDAQTIAVINDNDYGVGSPASNGQIVATGKTTRLYVYHLPESKRLKFVSPYQQERQKVAKGRKPRQ